ncbi:MAG: winged helix-turn-helix domain-containing protein [Bryobacterales bacterium]|nr:winged helix-turn-helix domain-containing protein [Bryobacterales bacterium]
MAALFAEGEPQAWVARRVRQGARKHRFAAQLWTLPPVAAVMEKMTGVRFHPGHVWKKLSALNWSVQKPAQQARECSPHRWLVLARRGAAGWQPFRPFNSRFHRDLRDPNLKFVDLDGEGHAECAGYRKRRFCLASVQGGARLRPRRACCAGARRGERSVHRVCGRNAIHLPGRDLRRRSDRRRPCPQRRGLLLAERRLRPLRRQVHDGQCALVRPPEPVRSHSHLPDRHRRQRHHGHHLLAQGRGAPVLQPIRE